MRGSSVWNVNSQPASPDVTVALTGVSSTVSVGTLLPSNVVSLTGNASTVSVGNLTPSSAKVITGNAATVSVGTIVPSNVVAFTGVSSQLSYGLVAPGASVPITGVSSTASTGTVTASIGGDVTVAINGVSLTANAGTITPSIVVPFTGTASAASVGSIIPSVDVTPPVVRDLGGGKRRGIKYIPPYYKEPKKQKPVFDPVVVEEEIEQEQEPVIKNPVIAIALRDALTKVKADTTKPIPQAVIEALSAPLQFPESPTPTKEELEAIAKAAAQAVLDEILEDDEEILSLFCLMHL